MPSNPGIEKSDRMTSGANSRSAAREGLLGVDHAMRDAQAGALQLAHLELGVGGDVLRRAAPGWWAPDAVTSPARGWSAPSTGRCFDTVSRKASNCTGLTM